MFFIYKKWGYNKRTLLCPGPSFPPLQTFWGNGRDCSHTHGYITSSANTSTHLFPQHKTKTSREVFFFQCLLSIYFRLLPLCLQQGQCSWAPGPTGFASAAFQPPEDGTRAAPPVQLAGTGLLQSWGDQAECWEHKQGLPVGQGLELGWDIPPQLCFQQIFKELEPWVTSFRVVVLLLFQVSLLLFLSLCCLLDCSQRAKFWKVAGRFTFIFEGEQIAAGI